MSEAIFKPGDIVSIDEGARTGVVVPDVLDKYVGVPVVFEGTNHAVEISSDLEVVGTYDTIIDDTRRCGAGLGASACRYLVPTQEGYRCARFDELGILIDYVAEDSLAKEAPTALKPDCQDQILDNAKE